MIPPTLAQQIRYHTRKHEPEDNLTGYLNQKFSFENIISCCLQYIMTKCKMFHSIGQQREFRPRIRRQFQPTILDNRRFRIFSLTNISVILICYIISGNLSLTTLLMNSTLRPLNENSRVHLVNASPAPGPSPASSRSATSVSHRAPPINGSIFGKRSVNNLVSSTTREQTNSKSRTTGREQNNIDSYTISDDKSFNDLTKYNEIITDIIEEFLAKNAESEPEESAVAFCRMIVYECNQLLTTRRGRIAAGNKKKAK